MNGRSHAGIMERLTNGTVLGAEGYVFELERRGYIKAGPYVPEVVLDFPDAVRELHREFLRAGSDVMVALTYYAHREKLRHVGREGDLEAMNRRAVRIAREVADAFKIAEILLKDDQDLIHKATGWALRTAGSRDRQSLLAFLDKHAATMPRVALRNSIEHFDKEERDNYLGMKAKQ